MIHSLIQETSIPSGAEPGSGAAVVEAQERRHVGRFRETRRVKALRAVLRALSIMLPQPTARLAYRLLAKPPRCAERRWQAALREKARTTRLRFGAGELAVYEWGSGPAILMVHGWGARATHMGKMIEPLVAAGFRVVSFDAPAHGNSSGRFTDLVEYAAAVCAVARHTGQIHALIAHSFGVAMALFARRDWGVGVQCQVFISSFNHCKWFTEAFSHYVGLTPSVIERARQMMVDRHSGRFSWEQLSVAEMLRRAPQPTLLIHDRDDGEIPFAHSEALLKVAHHAELYATSGLGHHRLLGNQNVIDRVVRFVSSDFYA